MEKVAQQAGKAAPAFAIVGALVAAPSASQALAASAGPSTATVPGHATAAVNQAAGTGVHTAKAALDSAATRTVTVTAARQARHAAVARTTHYSVRGGDTLSKIADRYYHNAGDWQYLYRENEKTVTDPDLIYVGQRLTIPATVPAHYALGDYTPRHARSTAHTTSAVTGSRETHHSGGGNHVVTQSVTQGMYGCSGLERLWEQAGGRPGAALMAAEIAMAESGGNPNAISPTDDFGLWQINGSNGALATLNASQNAKSAITLSDNGINWNPWTTYRTGAYAGRC
ncbi:MAG: LysM peptidoglycan-binding domain-containing protein [Trebonia sp.]